MPRLSASTFMARTASDFFANFLSRLCRNSSGVTMPVRAMSAPMTMTFANLGGADLEGEGGRGDADGRDVVALDGYGDEGAVVEQDPAGLQLADELLIGRVVHRDDDAAAGGHGGDYLVLVDDDGALGAAAALLGAVARHIGGVTSALSTALCASMMPMRMTPWPPEPVKIMAFFKAQTPFSTSRNTPSGKFGIVFSSMNLSVSSGARPQLVGQLVISSTKLNALPSSW